MSSVALIPEGVRVIKAQSALLPGERGNGKEKERKKIKHQIPCPHMHVRKSQGGYPACASHTPSVPSSPPYRRATHQPER